MSDLLNILYFWIRQPKRKSMDVICVGLFDWHKLFIKIKLYINDAINELSFKNASIVNILTRVVTNTGVSNLSN